jgi:hypothetical protein
VGEVAGLERRGEQEGTWTHPCQQFCLLCTRARVLRPLRGEARPNRQARAVGGVAEKELTSLRRLLHGTLLLRALGDAAISRPTVLFACTREEAVGKISEQSRAVSKRTRPKRCCVRRGEEGGELFERHSHVPCGLVRAELLQTVHKRRLVPHLREVEFRTELLKARVCVLVPGGGTTRDGSQWVGRALRQCRESRQGRGTHKFRYTTSCTPSMCLPGKGRARGAKDDNGECEHGRAASTSIDTSCGP